MKQILALVEGQTEDAFFRETCNVAKSLRVLPNGEDVPLDKVVAVIVANIEIHSSEYKTILIWYDREGRQALAADIAAELATKLTSKVSDRTILIGIPDKKIENWILADEDVMRAESQQPAYAYVHEGAEGKGILRRLLGGESLSPTATARLLKSSFASRIASKSTSFSLFFGSARTLDWYWIQR